MNTNSNHMYYGTVYYGHSWITDRHWFTQYSYLVSVLIKKTFIYLMLRL